MPVSRNKNLKIVALFVLVLVVLSLMAWGNLFGFFSETEPESAAISGTREASQTPVSTIHDSHQSTATGSAPDYSLGESQDLRHEVADLEAKAAAGSVIARRRLAMIYGACFGYSLDPDAHFAMIDAFAAHSGGHRQPFESLKSRTDQRCLGANGGKPISIDEIRHLMESAAQGGDLVAQIDVETHSIEPIKAEKMEELIAQVISSRDPDAMLAMSSLARKGIDGSLDMPYSMLVGDPISEAAWAIAGCQAGANCGPGSIVLDSICTGTGACGYTSYEMFLRQHMVPPGEVSRLNEYLLLILNGP